MLQAIKASEEHTNTMHLEYLNGSSRLFFLNIGIKLFIRHYMTPDLLLGKHATTSPFAQHEKQSPQLNLLTHGITEEVSVDFIIRDRIAFSQKSV